MGSKEMFMEERENELSGNHLSGLFRQDYPVSKSTIEAQAAYTVDKILENGSPINAAQLISSVEQFIKLIRGDKRLVDYVRDELAKSSGKITLASGTKIESAEVGTSYDYSQCNDPILEEMYTEQVKINDAVKAREAFLKAVPAKGMEIVYRDYVSEIYPPAKKSISSYKVTLAK